MNAASQVENLAERTDDAALEAALSQLSAAMERLHEGSATVH
jgi:hypothetical protein